MADISAQYCKPIGAFSKWPHLQPLYRQGRSCLGCSAIRSIAPSSSPFAQGPFTCCNDLEELDFKCCRSNLFSRRCVCSKTPDEAEMPAFACKICIQDAASIERGHFGKHQYCGQYPQNPKVPVRRWLWDVMGIPPYGSLLKRANRLGVHCWVPRALP